MKKLVRKALILAVLLLLINQLVNLFLPAGWANRRVRAKLDVVEDPDCDVNLLFLGSSRTYRHVDPARFDELLAAEGVRSFNLAGPSFFNPERYAVLELILDRPPESLRTIIYEIDIFRRPAARNRHTARNLYWRTPRYASIAARSTWENDTRTPGSRLRDIAMEVEELVARSLNAGMGGDILLTLFSEPDQWALGPARNGFYSLSAEHATRGGPSADEIDERSRSFRDAPQRLEERRDDIRRAFEERDGFTARDRVHVDLIRSMIARAEEKNIHLVFLVPARVPPCARVLALHDALPEANRIELADPRRYPELYEVATSFDHGHFDAIGARRYTTLLAERYREIRHSGR